MVTHWLLGHRPGAPFQLPLTQVTALLQKLGLSGRDAVAEDLLQVVGEHVPLAQCTIFAYEGRARPRMVAIGDRSRTEALPHITQGYLSRYHRLDSILAVMETELPAARRAPAEWPHIVLHRQSVADINHPGYRDLCYEQPQISERLSVLALYDGWRWLSVNFYRGLEHGPLTRRPWPWSKRLPRWWCMRCGCTMPVRPSIANCPMCCSVGCNNAMPS